VIVPSLEIPQGPASEAVTALADKTIVLNRNPDLDRGKEVVVKTVKARRPRVKKT
jgi:predicted RNA-binding protein with PUA domain